MTSPIKKTNEASRKPGLTLLRRTIKRKSCGNASWEARSSATLRRAKDSFKMLLSGEVDSSKRHLDEGRKLQRFPEIDTLLQLLRSTEFVGTIDPEHHSHYLKAFGDLNSPEAPNKEENCQSTKVSYKEERNSNMGEEIQELRNMLDTAKLGPAYHQSRHLRTTMDIFNSPQSS
jgi:hypothetical protein